MNRESVTIKATRITSKCDDSGDSKSIVYTGCSNHHIIEINDPLSIIKSVNRTLSALYHIYSPPPLLSLNSLVYSIHKNPTSTVVAYVNKNF